MTIVVTGATGQLGRLVIASLIERGVPAGEIVAAVRTPEKAADLAARGVQVREADYSRPETLPAAFAGAAKVLLISGSEVGQRVPQHQAAVDAAKAARVGHLAYTSVLRADTTDIIVAPEHKITEEYILASGLPYTFLRNSWYTEVFTPTVTQAATSGVIIGSAGDGLVSSATRADYADAAAAVLSGTGHENKVYELAGDTAWAYSELAAAVAEAAGRDVVYQDLPTEQHAAALTEAGLPAELVGFLTGIDEGVKRGDLEDHSKTLSTLIGRPTTPLADAVAELLKNA